VLSALLTFAPTTPELLTLDADKADKSTTITAGDKEVTGQHETTN